MLYILLTIIAIGILLASEAGKKLLSFLGMATAILGGICIVLIALGFLFGFTIPKIIGGALILYVVWECSKYLKATSQTKLFHDIKDFASTIIIIVISFIVIVAIIGVIEAILQFGFHVGHFFI